MDGYEVARAMRADTRLQARYLVAVSGYASPEDIEKSLAAGFDRHFGKPLDPNVLEKLVADAPEHEPVFGTDLP